MRGLFSAFLGICFAVGIGCRSGQSDRNAAVTADVVIAPGEALGIDDVFDVRVFGEESLSGSYRVADDGSVDYPFAGRISVVGKSSGEVQRLLTERLSDGFLKNPQVSVMVKEWNSRKVSVLGQVQNPGAVVYFPSMTIVDAIASAGGFTGIAAPNKVTLRREVDGKVHSTIYPVADISEGKRANVSMVPGDVLVVEERVF